MKEREVEPSIFGSENTEGMEGPREGAAAMTTTANAPWVLNVPREGAMLDTVHTHLSYSSAMAVTLTRSHFKGDRVDGGLERWVLVNKVRRKSARQLVPWHSHRKQREMISGTRISLFSAICVRMQFPTSISPLYKPFTVTPTGLSPWQF